MLEVARKAEADYESALNLGGLVTREYVGRVEKAMLARRAKASKVLQG
jgi:hypothetical protein